MSSLLQPGSVLAHARETESTDEPEIAFLGPCESCEGEVADGDEVVIHGRLYHEWCAERIADWGGTR